MSSYPNFSGYGYTISRELGQNLSGGRVTYLATENKTSKPVVIKQFQFAQSTKNWRGYDAIHREIEVLQKLNHPSIPRYLTSFETSSGFCLVQEYKQAVSLASSGQFTPLEIRQIAIAVLEVLVYLQQQHPPIIHRDIKPENILVARDENSENLKVYVVDFGFARLGEGDFASSLVKGTLGFMPPEQIRNLQLTQASDLYSLGATLICLLTGTKSENIGELIDENYKMNFVNKLPSKVNRAFIGWLQKMVEPKLSDRFPNAEVALKALNSDKVVGKKVINFPKYDIKLLKFSASGLLALSALAITVYGGIQLVNAHNKRVEQQRLEAEQKRKEELEQQRIAELKRQKELEQQRLEEEQRRKQKLEQQRLINQLQASKLCVGCNLQGVNLTGLFLEKVNLKGANLKGANLEGTKLKGANLEGANLEGATLNNADLENAILKGTKLESANLAGAKLESANLNNANLKNANFNEDSSSFSVAVTDLEGANLEEANLEGANLYNAWLTKANLEGANLENANLVDAGLENANLKNANLKNADLSKANLSGANLDGANTVGAKFNGASR